MILFRLLASSVIAIPLVAGVWAQTFRAEGAMVLVNEYPVVNLKATLDGRSPVVRSKAIVETLRARGVKLPISTRVTPTGTWIMSGATQIVRVTKAEAIAHGTTLTDLVGQWKSRIEYSLRLPAVQVNQSHLLAAVGSTQFVRVFGTEALKIELDNKSPETVRVGRREGGVVLEFDKAGSAEVWLRSAGGSARITVRIQASAIQELRPLSGDVVGSPPSVEAVRQAAATVVRLQLKTAPDATIEVLGVNAVRPIPGSIARASVRIRVRAPGTTPFDGNVQVNLTPVAFVAKRESELWYSNVPESVREFGVLFSGELRRGTPVRMLYHHLNDLKTPMAIQIVAYNPSDSPAKLLLTRGEGELSTNPVKAGLEAGERYLKAWKGSQGEVINVPPKARVPIAIQQLSPQVTLSGLATLSLLGDADRLIVQTESLRPSQVDPLWRIDAMGTNVAPPRGIPEGALAGERKQNDHIYRDPFRDLEATYRVGGRFTFVRIGQVPIDSLDLQRTLQGNFGVVYNLKAELENPTPKVEYADVVFEASAGYSGGVFAIDGVIQPSSILQSKGEVLLKRVRLAPGERRTMRVTTIPLSGSSYPATLVIRPRNHSN